MSEEKYKNKKVALVVLFILIALLGYLTYIFVPIWTYHFDYKYGIAKIRMIDKKGRTINYSYFNEYVDVEIVNIKHVRNEYELNKFREGSQIKITYSKHFTGFVKFENIDENPAATLTIIVYIIVLSAIGLYIGVLLNKISLETLSGVSKNK